MSKINNDNYNRLEVNPLIEENMTQMLDSEFSISQLTGHVTLKREDKYISKTKELTEANIDLNSFLKDINDKHYNLIENDNMSSEIENIETLMKEALEKIETIRNKLEEYEKIAKGLDEDINQTDEYIINTLAPSITELYGSSMSSNIKELGKLLVWNEQLDIILDNEEYFKTFVGELFNYLDASGNVKNYGTEKVLKENKEEMEKRVYISTYEAYVKDLEARYANLVKSINDKTNFNLTGSYKITGWK